MDGPDATAAEAFLPIEDYGAIGNLRTVALVGRNGSIDWCCLPELATPSVFAALLDPEKGGRFRVAAAGAGKGRQRYLEGSNVLETAFEGERGRLLVTDFMPLRGRIGDLGEEHTRPEIHRLLRCAEGEVEVIVEWRPRFDYARAATGIARRGSGFLAVAAMERLTLEGLPGGEVAEDEFGPLVRSRFELRAGERLALVTRYGAREPQATLSPSLAALEETLAAWRAWLRLRQLDPRLDRWRDRIERSELTLKLLTHEDTGAIMAAGTASLPEVVGGERNWDYRYSWLRDSALAVRALMNTGHLGEARSFTEWANRAARDRGTREEGLQTVFGLHGESELPSVRLAHLRGYRDSRPVHVGNGASDQWQHDTYGELLGAVHELLRRGGELDADVWPFVASLPDEAARTWRRPDYGFWEMPNGPKHYVHSKWSVAHGLELAASMAREYGLQGDVARWERERNAARAEVLEKGYDPELGAFVLAYGSQELDAANLLMPARGFLPADDPRVLGTIDLTLQRLTDDRLVYRYLADDGLAGREGAFVACTFWLADALAQCGRWDESVAIFEGIAGRANHVGLYSEEIDPRSGAFLGNFPQALSHIGFLNSVTYQAGIGQPRARARGGAPRAASPPARSQEEQ